MNDYTEAALKKEIHEDHSQRICLWFTLTVNLCYKFLNNIVWTVVSCGYFTSCLSPIFILMTIWVHWVKVGWPQGWHLTLLVVGLRYCRWAGQTMDPWSDLLTKKQHNTCCDSVRPCYFRLPIQHLCTWIQYTECPSCLRDPLLLLTLRLLQSSC